MGVGPQLPPTGLPRGEGRSSFMNDNGDYLMTEEQWKALVAFVKSEAEYAANENFNRNDCGDSLRRMEAEKVARDAFLGEQH